MDRQEAILRGARALVDDLTVYAARCLTIKDKLGVKMPLIFNESQRRTHELLEKQLRETGKVRALILKYRQGGISTYIAARFYHRATTKFGQKVFVMAHETKATNNLYDMVLRYHEHNPLPISTGNSNAKELIFDRLDGGYALATAGTEDVGRSATAQMLHGSEAAFWANAQLHMAGIGNTVSDFPGTEVILESTANGVGGPFHEMWQAAEAGLSEFLPIFLPWFIQPEYRAPVRPDFHLSEKDEKYMRAYGLDMEQMQWRANKTASYGKGFSWLFPQEYPATAVEAFQTSTQNPLISPEDVQLAQDSGFKSLDEPLVIGVDCAGDGVASKDRTAIAARRGRTVIRIEYHEKLNTMQIVGRVAAINRDESPSAIFIDKTGLGTGVYDRLQELNVKCVGINGAARPNNTTDYENKRAECWYLMKEWFEDHPNRLPRNSALVSDICAPQPRIASSGKKMVEKKEDMEKRGVRSPDGGDALSLTFAEPVTHDDVSRYRNRQKTQAASKAGY